MAILEAAQFGKPVIGPNHGGFTEIIGEGDAAIGRLFRPGNVDDLERHVVALWNNPNEIARLGERLMANFCGNIPQRGFIKNGMI